MSTFKITHDQTSTYNITGTGNTWILKKGVQISSTNDGIGMLEPSVLKNNDFIIEGKIVGVGIMSSAMSLAGANADIEIAKSGNLSGNYGLKSYGADATITNFGVIAGKTTGVEIHGADASMVNHGTVSGAAGAAIGVLDVDRFSLFNDGEISGGRGIYSAASNLTVTLGKHSVIETSGTTIESISKPGDHASIVNKGTLSSDGNIFSLVIDGRDGVEHVRNAGRIDGSLSLGGGDDIYDGRGGKVSGVINGGLGNDTYSLSNKNDFVHEFDGQGYDTLKVSFSYTLPSDESIESLRLIGKSNASLHGNDHDAALVGNAGRNKLSGGAGNDALSGGAGTDFLTGGDGLDFFDFHARAGKEIITDFTDGLDTIYFAESHDITSIKDALAHHTRQVGDDVVISGDGTQMILKNFDIANLAADDFYG